MSTHKEIKRILLSKLTKVAQRASIVLSKQMSSQGKENHHEKISQPINISRIKIA